jgi:hypothetical protein
MTEERKCYNCAIDLTCQECNEDNSKWQPITQEKPNNTNLCNSCESMCYSGAVIKCADYKPKDKPMENKVIFESEEQFVNFWKDLTGCDCLPGTREKIKQKGYIRKSAVEEAEEMYSKHVEYKGNLSGDDKNKTIDKMYLAIHELKSEIARLKK